VYFVDEVNKPINLIHYLKVILNTSMTLLISIRLISSIYFKRASSYSEVKSMLTSNWTGILFSGTIWNSQERAILRLTKGKKELLLKIQMYFMRHHPPPALFCGTRYRNRAPNYQRC
jgi:hypothetical protein